MEVTPRPLGAGPSYAVEPAESSKSAVSWAAIIAGAFVAASASVVLMALGVGLSFASVSVFSLGAGSATRFTVMTAIWLIVVQWVAAFLGGYVTGRLRIKWAALHTHEVFLRDTAHGFITWAVAIVLSAFVLGTAGYSWLAGGTRVESASSAAGSYEVDKLFRSERTAPSASSAETRVEATRILGRGIADAALPPADRAYLAHLVSEQTGLGAAEADTRVDQVFADVQQAADRARHAASETAIFTGLALLIGAFIACVAAALGGRERDEHP
jgi:hypothetical protein